MIHTMGCLFELASSKRDKDNPYGFGYGLNEHGWDEFVHKYMTPAYKIGFRNFLLHLPGGRVLANGQMSFDSSTAIYENLRFDNQMRSPVSPRNISRFMEQVQHEMPDTNIIIYNGNMRAGGLPKKLENRDLAGYVRSTMEVIEPWLEYDIVDFAFDTAINNHIESPEWAYIKYLEAILAHDNRMVYVEALPRKDADEVFRKMNAVCTESYFYGYVKHNLYDRTQLTGDRYIRIWDGHSVTKEPEEPKTHYPDNDINAWAADVKAMGMVPYISEQLYMRGIPGFDAIVDR